MNISGYDKPLSVRYFGLMLCLTLISLGSCDSTAQERLTPAEQALNTVVPVFELSNGGIHDALKKLNEASSVPINGEVNSDSIAPINLELTNQTLGTILTNVAFLAGCQAYTTGPCINLVDQAVAQDPGHAMNAPLANFDADNSSLSKVAGALFSRSEITDKHFYITVIQRGRKSVLDRPTTLHLTNGSPREILNQCVAVDSSVYWTICRSDGYNFFDFKSR